MTPEEQAENVLNDIGSEDFSHADCTRIKRIISKAIREAVEEAQKDNGQNLDACRKERYRAGLEDAAGIADDEECVCTDDINCHGATRIAKTIRAKASRSSEPE